MSYEDILKPFIAHIEYTDERPRCLLHGLVIFLALSDPAIIVLDGLIRIPTTILYASKYVLATGLSSCDTYVGRGYLDAANVRLYYFFIVTK
jgi:hypothetical protein